MITREDIQTAALLWIGTPFQHFQCSLGNGVDCAHLIIGIGKMVKALPEDFKVPYYHPQFHVHKESTLLLDTLYDSGFVEKSVKDKLPGDVLAIRLSRNFCHVAILMPENRIIHAYPMRRAGRVTYQPMPASWIQRLHCVFLFPNLGS